ncbi:MAG: hypothetical protein JSV80_12690 [Acidobacteriota bacterium]|nr:MAG: hypothetical protein JSV80_12690 [Acidobacteriota bacterium]
MGRWPASWPSNVYFIGIGGVAMSAMAVLLSSRGARVRGSDRAVYPPASDALAAAGIAVATPFDGSHLDPAPELVVVGNAISRGNPELELALDRGMPLCSMAELIERLLVPGRRVSVVAGTHGKTTTASMLAALHDAAGREPSFVIGGLPGNFASGARLAGGDDLIVEGDEYDTAFFDKGPKFLHYWPRIAVLGGVEFDHADIYRDLAAVERAFALFVRLVPASGTLVVDGEDEIARRLSENAPARVVRVGLEEKLDLSVRERRDDAGGQRFVVLDRGRPVAEAQLALPGPHNAKNALAALAAARAAGLALETAVPLLSRFRPPRRRLELVTARDGVIVYDDFAHHPTAIAHTLATLRAQVPTGGRLIACVEPRSNTMVRSLIASRLERALAGADRVFIGPVDRPERFSVEQRLDVAALAARLRERGTDAHGPCEPAEILARLLAERLAGDRIVLMSNGGFGGLAASLRERLGGSAS